MKEEPAFFMQISNFSKIQSKIFEIFFLNIATFSYRRSQTLSSDMRIIFLLSIMKEEQAFFLLALQTDRQTDARTDGRTYTFLKSPRHTDSNGI